MQPIFLSIFIVYHTLRQCRQKTSCRAKFSATAGHKKSSGQLSPSGDFRNFSHRQFQFLRCGNLSTSRVYKMRFDLFDFLKLGKNDVLIIEGIHCLNDKLSYSLPAESRFKIYISALTQLNVDEHNRIPTADGRIIRRMVRDARTRGTSALETIRRWSSVRRGEDKNIFPFQEQADVMFNSALVYELAVLKLYAEPLLFSIPRDVPEYDEAKRLLKFLDYFLGIDSEIIPKNSIIREFIGGSCLKV